MVRTFRRMLGTDDLALLSESLEGKKGRLEAWKKALKSRRLKVMARQQTR